MKWIMGFIIVVLVRLIFLKQKKKNLTQYLFFIRYPILLGLFLALFPILAPLVAPYTLGVLFVLEPAGIGSVYFFSCLCSWAIVYTGLVIWHSAPIRQGIYFDKELDAAVHSERCWLLPTPSQLISRRLALGSLLLTLPLGIVLVLRVDGEQWQALVAILLGGICAVILRSLSGAATEWAVQAGVQAFCTAVERNFGFKDTLPYHIVAYRRHSKVCGIAKENADPIWGGYHKQHFKAATFALISLGFYLVVGLVPVLTKLSFLSNAIPALTYLLGFYLVTIWVLGWISFIHDHDRIPVVSFILFLIIIWDFVWPSGHVFHLPLRDAPKPADVRVVLNNFMVTRPDGSLVVVAASGGGITAAFWETTVLGRLGRELSLNHFDFHQHVALVSSVSGGSVGAMYYIDAFGPMHGPADKMDSVITAAGASSLSATAWGLVYLDFPRLAFGRLMGRYDRGLAQELRWGSFLERPHRTILDWVEGVQQGWRPIQLFNVTLQETGERSIIAPITVPRGASALRRNFLDMYSGHDIALVTAARLSATFPYVSPPARPDLPRGGRPLAFHMADGGYYDNTGIVSALDVLGDWLDSDSYNHSVKKIALVEISASGSGDSLEDDSVLDNQFGGLFTAPMEILLNVRKTSQAVRNEFELSLVRQLWHSKQGIEFSHFRFRLGSDTPLSWHLNKADKVLIQSHWPTSTPLRSEDPRVQDARNYNLTQLQALRRFLAN